MMNDPAAALAKALHTALRHSYHGGGWDHGDGDLAGELLAALRADGYEVVPVALREAAEKAEKACRTFIDGTFERSQEVAARMALEALRAALAASATEDAK